MAWWDFSSISNFLGLVRWYYSMVNTKQSTKGYLFYYQLLILLSISCFGYMDERDRYFLVWRIVLSVSFQCCTSSYRLDQHKELNYHYLDICDWLICYLYLCWIFRSRDSNTFRDDRILFIMGSLTMLAWIRNHRFSLCWCQSFSMLTHHSFHFCYLFLIIINLIQSFFILQSNYS